MLCGKRPRSTMWMMVVVVVVLLFLCFSPSLSQVGSLVQVLPSEDDPICLGNVLSYNCSVTDTVTDTSTVLRWSYTNGEGPVEEVSFHVSDPVPNEQVLGPFKFVLVSSDSINGTSMLTSTATIDNGVMEDVNNKSISCVSQQFSASKTISIAEPEIMNATICRSTVYWSPPPCDANCTVSVDGQDIGTVPCSVGNLSVESDLSTKTVNITALDQLGQSAVVQAVPAIDMRMPCYVPSPETHAVSPSETSTTMPDASTNTTVIIGVVVPVVVVAVIMVVAVVVLVALCCIHFKRKGRKQDILPVSYAGKAEGVYVGLHESSDHHEAHEAKSIQKPEDKQRLVSKGAVSDPSDKSSDHHEAKTTQKKKDKQTLVSQKVVIDPPSSKDADKGSDHHEAKTSQKQKDKQSLVSQKVVSDPPSGKNADESSDHHEAKTTAKSKDKQTLVSQKAVSDPPWDKDADGEQNRNTSPIKSKVEHRDSGPSAMKPVKVCKKLIVDGEIKVYKGATCTSPIIHCKISPVGDYIATADLDKCVRVLKCDTGDTVKHFMTASAVLSLQWVEHDAEDALMAADHSTMKIFDVEKGNALVDFKFQGFPKHSRVLCLVRCTSRSVFALSCQLPRKGKDGDDDIGQVIIDGHGKGKNKMMWSQQVTPPVSCMVFNYHGTQLITGNMEGKITIFDIQEEGDISTVTVRCDLPTPHGIVYNLLYNFDEQYVYSIGKNDEFLVQSKLPISHPPEATLSISSSPETKCLKIKAGATSAVQNSDEALPVCGQFFCLMEQTKYILTSSHSQGIVYKVKGWRNAVEKLALHPFDANITCVDCIPSTGVKFTCVLGCADNSVRVMDIIIKI